MDKKKEDSKSKSTSEQKEEEEEQRLLEKHPFETMSQVQNRYGHGREQNGSDGTHEDASRLNH